MHGTDSDQYAGILLAAGQGKRFDPSGAQDKLMQLLPVGATVAATAGAHLIAVLPQSLAVIRPGAESLAMQLRTVGCEITICPNAVLGMSRSLVHALSNTADAAGWVIALADMPYVRSSTIAALLDAVKLGADIAVPVYRGQRGNPVAFSRKHLPALLRLEGDQGARRLFDFSPVVEIAVDDPGIRRDIDSAIDLTI